MCKVDWLKLCLGLALAYPAALGPLSQSSQVLSACRHVASVGGQGDKGTFSGLRVVFDALTLLCTQPRKALLIKS